uniref:Uncharacterized protein n=1 Tax=Clostridium perfringens TaxID=1502 RepID=F7J0D4_CLOPF|nr:hypothetical protein [Clostridium perfringens]
MFILFFYSYNLYLSPFNILSICNLSFSKVYFSSFYFVFCSYSLSFTVFIYYKT